MQASLYIDYFSIAHNETVKSVPQGVILNFFRKFRFASYITGKFRARFIKDFASLNLELEGIHKKMMEKEISLENLESDFENTKKIIRLLTLADEWFEKINYFDSELLKQEVKNTLNNSYLIEVELKDLIFSNKKKTPMKDDLFMALAEKSNSNLSRAL